MKTHRFIGDFKLGKGPYTIIDDQLVHQIWDVLKLRSGEEIVLCDGNLLEGRATISSHDQQGIQVEILETQFNDKEPVKKVTLYAAILKNENFELVCQKATEAGVGKIVPIITERTIKTNIRSDRLQKIIKEAAEQSGRGRIPILGETLSFEEVLKTADQEAKVFFDKTGESAGEFIGSSVALVVGPEGGWTEKEVQLAREGGFQIVSLGSRILRAETAAIISVWLAAKEE